MRIHVYEYVTGGGLAGNPLPESLRREGMLMRDALLADLLDLRDVDVSIAVDPRCPLPAGIAHSPVRPVVARSDSTPEAAVLDGIASADAAWIIAPETSGELSRLAEIVLASGKRLVGARPEAIAVAASKTRTASVLRAHGIEAAPAFAVDAVPTGKRTDTARWVVKPDDGAGCVETWQCASATAARARAARAGAGFVVQRWIDGPALSLSAVATEHGVDLLSVNRQAISIDEGVVQLDGVVVNAVPREPRYEALARAVVAAIPGLQGYFGVDLVLAGQPCVIEVNPRLTTSYAGLRAARSINVAARVLGLEARGDADVAHDRPIALDLAFDDGRRGSR